MYYPENGTAVVKMEVLKKKVGKKMRVFGDKRLIIGVFCG